MTRENLTLPYESKCYVCTHVFEGALPVLLVSRPEGDWCLLCGNEHPDMAESYRVVGIGHILDGDPTLLEVMDLGVDEEAERRDRDDAWRRSKIAE